MATQIEKVQRVIDVLKDASDHISAELKDYPDLALRGNSVLKRLINGYAHVVGMPVDGEDDFTSAKLEKIQLTHIAGTAVTAREVINPEVTTSAEEDEDLKEFVDIAHEDFANGHDAQSLLDSYEDLIIRGVAKKAGMPDITPTNPAEMTVDFVVAIQEFIKANPAK